MQQQLALALGRMVVPRAVEIFGDIGTFQPHFTPTVNGDERLGERRPPLAQRLDLGPGQHQSRLVLVLDQVIMPGLAVLCDEHSALFLCHGLPLQSLTSTQTS